MSSPALDTLLPQSEPVPAGSDEPILRPARCDVGCYAWLAWLHRLLSGDALQLYRTDLCDGKVHLSHIGSLPENQAPPRTAIKALVLRAARCGSVVRAKNATKSDHCVVCIPDTAHDAQPSSRYVLVIERSGSSKLDVQTQSRLVTWAFAAIVKFTATSVTTFAPTTVSTTTSRVPEATLSQWSLEQLDRQGSLNDRFAQLMQTLAELSFSQRCLVVKLKLRGEHIRGSVLMAISGQARVDNRLAMPGALARSVEKIYQGQKRLSIRCEDSVAPYGREHECASGLPILCSRLVIPVHVESDCYVVLLERAVDQPFTGAEQADIGHELNTAVQVLVLRDLATQGIACVIKRRLNDCREGFRAQRTRNVTAGAALILALSLLLYPVEHRVTAPLSVEAAERYVLIAPIDGFVRSVRVKAGDVVAKDQIIAALDDLDLQLQWQQRQSEQMQNSQAYAKALATRNRVEVTRLKERARLLQAELSQLQMQRDRLVLRAPVSGVVLSGALDDFLGAAVSAGDTLFSIGSNTSHRLVLEVSEYDVNSVKPGQPVGIRLSADPSIVLEATVTTIMPLATLVNGVNSVQVHAVLNNDAQLRPGMEGLGKILLGTRSRLNQWRLRIGARLIWLGWKLGVIR